MLEEARGRRVAVGGINSMHEHLWIHTGELDESGTVLTLATEGPILGDPTTSTEYREIIEAEGDDHYVVRSLIRGPDSELFEFARAEKPVRRVKGVRCSLVLIAADIAAWSDLLFPASHKFAAAGFSRGVTDVSSPVEKQSSTKSSTTTEPGPSTLNPLCWPVCQPHSARVDSLLRLR